MIAPILMTVALFAPADLVRQLADAKTAGTALESLIREGQAAVPALVGEALEGRDLEARGWAIAALAEIGGADAEKALARLKDDAKAPALVRTWAAAGVIRQARDLPSLVALSPLVQQFPALQRPFGLRVTKLASESKDAEALIKATIGNWQLQQALAEAILASGVEPLLAAMTRSSDLQVRMQAAGYLGTLAQRQGMAGNELVGDAVAKAYAFDPDAKDVPWAGGPLYVPNIGWDRAFALKLTRNLVSWWVWCDRKDRKAEKTQIHNSLNSIAIAGQVGYPVDWGPEPNWLERWGRAAGKKEVRAILEKQGIESDPRWKRIVEGM